jgi:hypothetical protein
VRRHADGLKRRYAEYVPDRRWWWRKPPAPVPSVPASTLADRIGETSITQLFWVIVGAEEGPWRLRLLDDRTGQLRDAPDDAPVITDEMTRAEVSSLVSRHTGVFNWSGINSPEDGVVEEAYVLIRELAYKPRTGRSLVLTVGPSGTRTTGDLVVVRERWDATGLLADPILRTERKDLGDDEQMLATISDWLRVSREGWREVTPGLEYQHS